MLITKKNDQVFLHLLFFQKQYVMNYLCVLHYRVTHLLGKEKERLSTNSIIVWRIFFHGSAAKAPSQIQMMAEGIGHYKELYKEKGTYNCT